MTGLERVADSLAARGLQPIIDPVMELVRSECPDCHAGECDPLGLYRPLIVTRRQGGARFRCEACGGASGV